MNVHSGKHRVTFQLAPGVYSIWSTIHCDADPMAACHRYCPIAECEDGCVAPDEHEQSINPTCNVKDWLEQDQLEETYGGPLASVHDGPIEVEWDGNGFRWTYAEATA